MAAVRAALWWSVAGTAAVALAVLVGVAAGPTPHELRWTGLLLSAAVGGTVTALIGPQLLPLARSAASGAWQRTRRIRPVTSGALTAAAAAVAAYLAATLFPSLLAPVHLEVGRGVPAVVLGQLPWAVLAAAAVGGVLGLVGWAVVHHPDAVAALAVLVRRAGWASQLSWLAAVVTVTAAGLAVVTLPRGAPGVGTPLARAAAVAAHPAGWRAGWALWALSSLGVLVVLVLLIERTGVRWRTLAVATAAVAIALDLVATVLLAAAAPVAAAAAQTDGPALFQLVETTAMALSGAAANALYGLLGLALIRAAGRTLHPLVKVIGAVAFATVLADAVLLPLAPDRAGPSVALSVVASALFAAALGWQLAVSRRTQPALESAVRRATRALVPAHPLPARAELHRAVVVELVADPARLAPLVPEGWQPEGRVLVVSGTLRRARPGSWPAGLSLPATPLAAILVPVASADGRRRLTPLRGFAPNTLTAALLHWTTLLELSRVELVLARDGDRYAARGAAGAVEYQLHPDPTAPLPQRMPWGPVLVDRGGQHATVEVAARHGPPTPARVERFWLPLLARCGAEVTAACVLDRVELTTSRARWGR